MWTPWHPATPSVSWRSKVQTGSCKKACNPCLDFCESEGGRLYKTWKTVMFFFGSTSWKLLGLDKVQSAFFPETAFQEPEGPPLSRLILKKLAFFSLWASYRKNMNCPPARIWVYIHTLQIHTVDGRNPAPPGMSKTSWKWGENYQPQLVSLPDFFQHQYVWFWNHPRVINEAGREFPFNGIFGQVMSLGIKQYVVLAFCCNFFLVAVKAWDWLQPSSCEAGIMGFSRSKQHSYCWWSTIPESFC